MKRDYIVIRKNSNSGIASSLAIGWDLLYFLDIDFLINLDSDTLVSNNWLSVLFNVHENISEQKTKCIVTGFNSCMTHVHKTINSFTQYNEKSSIGGHKSFF